MPSGKFIAIFRHLLMW